MLKEAAPETKMQPYLELFSRIRREKTQVLNQLDQYISQTEARLRAKDCGVFLAETATEARSYIQSLVQDASLFRISGSRTLAEISIAPNQEYETSPQATIKDKRQSFKHALVDSRYGLTGADAIVASTGSLMMLEDAGNLRGVANMSYSHIAVAGVDQIVADLESALFLARASSVAQKGVDICTYVSFNTGPSQTGDIESKLVHGMHGPKEVQVILLDNGRHRMVAEGFSEALLCLNCDKCLKVCRAFQERGQDFGGKAYPGGIGIVRTAFSEGIEAARQVGLDACDGCGSCQEACYLKIDIPAMIHRLREQI